MKELEIREREMKTEQDLGYVMTILSAALGESDSDKDNGNIDKCHKLGDYNKEKSGPVKVILIMLTTRKNILNRIYN